MKALCQTSIYLEKSLRVILPEAEGNNVSPEFAATAADNLKSLGFGLSATLLERLACLREEQVAEWYDRILPILKEMVGAHHKFKPFYPNFPKQVKEASEAELYFNAITHYFGFLLSDALDDPNLVVLPSYEKEARPLLKEFQQLRWIELGSEENFDSIFTRLASSNGSLSARDQEILAWFAEHRDVDNLVPDKIPQKETLALLVSILPDPSCLQSAIKTATDVLRIAVAMSQGDISLAQTTKFCNFSKAERRFLLSALENVGETRTEDMLRWKGRWLRLGERLHPGDFKHRYPKALESFDVLRNKEPVKTFNRRVEDAVSKGDAAGSIRLLKQRPGDFARRLDHALRSHRDQGAIVDAFLQVANKVSTPVLLQLWHHFENRNGVRSRAFFPKGNAAKVQFDDSPLPDLPEELTAQVASGTRQVLVERFKELPQLGKVFLAKELEDLIVPFSQRSASRTLRSIARGSKFKLPEGETLRFFCWWKNIPKGSEWDRRVDIDLSVSLFKSNWELHGDISYYNLRQGDCYHSGDITSAPQGACEFVDINLQSVLTMGARYAVMSVLSFTGQPFLALPECFGGWMMRAEPNSGEVFEARTVQDKIDITAASKACVPVIVDAETRQIYWADLGLKSLSQINNASKNSVGFSQIGKAIVGIRKPALYDLLSMHAEARGEVVEQAEEADTRFQLRDSNTNLFDPSIILSEFLA
ncbi:MAG: TerD family protein [Planctomycetota bacterium]